MLRLTCTCRVWVKSVWYWSRRWRCLWGISKSRCGTCCYHYIVFMIGRALEIPSMLNGHYLGFYYNFSRNCFPNIFSDRVKEIIINNLRLFFFFVCLFVFFFVTHDVHPRQPSRIYIHNERPETMDEKYVSNPILRCRRNPECPEKTKLTHSHRLAALVKGKCSFTKPTRLVSGIVCHPHTNQNKPYKSTDAAGNWNGVLLHRNENSTIGPHYSY